MLGTWPPHLSRPQKLEVKMSSSSNEGSFDSLMSFFMYKTNQTAVVPVVLFIHQDTQHTIDQAKFLCTPPEKNETRPKGCVQYGTLP